MTRKWGRMATYPQLGNSQFPLHEESPHGDTPHSMQISVPSPNRPYPWSSGARNPGRNIKGETGFVAILGKVAKIHPKVVTRKIVSPYHKTDRPWAFAWMQTEALLHFCDKGWGSKRQGNISNTSILEAHYIWGKVHILAILARIYLWALEEQKYEQTILERAQNKCFQMCPLWLDCLRPPMSLAFAYERMCKEAVWHACSQGDAI